MTKLYLSVFQQDAASGSIELASTVRPYNETSLKVLFTEDFVFALVGRAAAVNCGAVLDAVSREPGRVQWWHDLPASDTSPRRFTCVRAGAQKKTIYLLGPNEPLEKLVEDLKPQSEGVLGLAPSGLPAATEWLERYLLTHAPREDRANLASGGPARESTAVIPTRQRVYDERAAVIAARRALLDRVESWSSEELAKHRGSFTQNASQLAADWRQRGDIFGVRVGKEWRYPAFQFEGAAEPKAAMRDILRTLGPDPQGWDTLQWFLTPHESLTSKQTSDRDQRNTGRPIDLLNVDPEAVMAAAQREHAEARD